MQKRMKYAGAFVEKVFLRFNTKLNTPENGDMTTSFRDKKLYRFVFQ